MKKIVFLFFILSYGCQSKKEKQQDYFNGYWEARDEQYNWKNSHFHHIQDSTIDILHFDIGFVKGLRFEIFPNDTIGISWNPENKNPSFQKSKFIIIDDDNFIAINSSYTDSLTKISAEKFNKKIAEENESIEIEPPRTK